MIPIASEFVVDGEGGVTFVGGMSLSQNATNRVRNLIGRANLGDPRLVRRAMGLAEALASHPKGSLPQVWSNAAELEAAYRFLRNPRTSFEGLMEAVQLAARDAALDAEQVLVLHDTTDVACQAAEPEEVGFLQTGKPGFYVHHALCVTGDGRALPLGVPWSQLWGRPQRSRNLGRNRTGSELAKLKERESDRWLEGITEAALWTEGCREVVHVMDREADSARVFGLLADLSSNFVIRMRHDRRLQDGGFVAEELAQAPVRFHREIAVSGRHGKTMPRHTHGARNARTTRLSVRAARVDIRPPRYAETTESIAFNVVQLLEDKPPKGEKPIAWVLATSLPVRTKAQLERVIDIYRARWVIEEFHKALKTGCMLEKRQLESFESITTLLAMSYPVAAELLRVRTRARHPNARGCDLLRATQLECLRVHPRAAPLSPDPTAAEVLGVIANLGGHQKNNGPPGWQTLAAGYQRLLDFEVGWAAAIEARDL